MTVKFAEPMGQNTNRYFATSEADWSAQHAKMTTEMLVTDLAHSYKMVVTPGVISLRLRLKTEIKRRWNLEPTA